MKRILEEEANGRLIEEILTDGSTVYNVELLATHADDTIIIYCTTREKAEFLFQWINDPGNVTGID